MILDKIENRATYGHDPRLKKVLDYMAQLTLENCPEKNVELDGELVRVCPVTLTTKPERECMYEAHLCAADVHFILEGTEKIRVWDVSGMKVHTPYNKERDICFFADREDGVDIVLHPGQFLVCYPQDAHMVGIGPDGCYAPVRKVVGKIRL